MIKIYLADEHGWDLPEMPGHGQLLLALGAWHQTPGMGLGRECRGFVNHIAFGEVSSATLRPWSSSYFLVAGSGMPPVPTLRVRLARVGNRGSLAEYWLVPKGTDSGEVRRLRDRMWPSVELPPGLPSWAPEGKIVPTVSLTPEKE